MEDGLTSIYNINILAENAIFQKNTYVSNPDTMVDSSLPISLILMHS